MKRVEFLKEKSKHEYVGPHSLAYIYARLGEKDSAFYYLQKMVEERSEALLFLKVNADWDGLRADPRFAELVRKVESEKR